MAVVFAVIGGLGVHYLYTSAFLDWRGLGPTSTTAGTRTTSRRSLADLLAQAGIPQVRVREFAAVSLVLFALGSSLAWAIFGSLVPTVALGSGIGLAPLAAARSARDRRRAGAVESWPRMIEEVRLQAVSLGRSVPQALLDVGARGPEELRPAFASARREWTISTDFERTLAVLKAELSDPTADAVAETLLIAHEIGGQEIDSRLRALAEDRILDLDGRKDARSRQAGARFARAFVLVVPLGMALVGLSIGDGRAAYRSPAGQLAVAIAVGLVGLCWWWAGRIMRLPDQERVFGEVSP